MNKQSYLITVIYILSAQLRQFKLRIVAQPEIDMLFPDWLRWLSLWFDWQAVCQRRAGPHRTVQTEFWSYWGVGALRDWVGVGCGVVVVWECVVVWCVCVCVCVSVRV